MLARWTSVRPELGETSRTASKKEPNSNHVPRKWHAETSPQAARSFRFTWSQVHASLAGPQASGRFVCARPAGVNPILRVESAVQSGRRVSSVQPEGSLGHPAPK